MIWLLHYWTLTGAPLVALFCGDPADLEFRDQSLYTLHSGKPQMR